MRHINLLPQKEGKVSFNSLNVFVIMLVFSFLMALSISYTIYQKRQIASLESKKEELSLVIVPLKAKKNEEEKVKDKNPEEEVRIEKTSWSKRLSKIAKMIPDQAYIEELKSEVGDGGHLYMTMVADRLATISEVKNNLSTLSWCKKIDINLVRRKETEEAGELLSFHVLCPQ